MKIRRYKEGDTTGIVELITTVMAEYGLVFDAKRLDSDLFNIPQYYGKKGAFWVLVDGDKVVGSIAVVGQTKEVCKFKRFYIYKEYRCQGWGTKMFEKRLVFARKLGFKEAHLVTTPRNLEAISFLEKNGARKSKTPLFESERVHLFYKIKIQG